MMITGSMFVIAVPDLQKSGAFYRDALGFKITEIGDSGWRMYVRDDCHIMAGECPDATPPQELGDHSYFCYLVVDAADEYHRLAVRGGAEILKPPQNEPWGMREFALRTVDGHRIMVGERLTGEHG